jgi:NAD(P)-dependent dehydrogenase (short-subunit alcohol dehydrogenase family)
MKIDGTVALVTGANRGLGRAFARALTERGARRVYAGARHPEDVIDPGVEPVKLDITSAPDIAEVLHHCREVSLLINNAADARPGSLTGAGSLENARAQMETNYLGTLAMCQAFAPVLALNGGGAIVNTLSIVSFFNYPALASFCPTKAALWSLTNGIRMELRPKGPSSSGSTPASSTLACQLKSTRPNTPQLTSPRWSWRPLRPTRRRCSSMNGPGQSKPPFPATSNSYTQTSRPTGKQAKPSGQSIQ